MFFRKLRVVSWPFGRKRLQSGVNRLKRNFIRKIRELGRVD